MTEKYIKRTQGFTLVELSIVIIIIGFLIAGIAAGQSLIKQAKLNSFIADIKETETAVKTFKAVYGYLPGDFPNATAFWPSEVCQAGVIVPCDGNGNGLVDGSTERYFAWDHLNQSKIVVSTFLDTNPNYPTSSKHVRIDQGFAMVIFVQGSPLYAQDLTTTNILDIYSDYGGNITPRDAFNLDSKMDDGNPSTGRLITLGWTNPICVVEGDGVTPILFGNYPNSDAQYDLGHDDGICSDIIYTFD